MIFSNLNLNLFKSFLAVYEAKNVTRAAESLSLTPTTVSQNIKTLEGQLGGVRLFIAHTKGVEPTREADELYKFVFAGFDDLRNAENFVREFNELLVGTIRVGCSSIIANFFLINYFTEFSKKYPKIKLEFHGDTKHGYINALSKRDIDLSLIFTSDPVKNPNIKNIELKKVANTFFASKTFAEKYGIKGVISLERLLELSLVLLSKSLGAIRVLQQKLGVKFSPVVEAATTEIMYSLVMDGMGIGYCAEEYLDAQSDDIVKFGIEGFALPHTSIELSFNENVINKPADAFIKGLIEFCRHWSAF